MFRSKILLVCLFFYFGSKAQVLEPSTLEINHQQKCGMSEAMQWLQSNYPDHYNQSIAYKNSEPTPMSLTAGVVYTIPIVIHVIHNGDAVGTDENISEAQILSQINSLNNDFRRMNADASSTPSVFSGVAADVEIEFCLAQRDPNGNPSNGIDRVNGGQSSWSQSQIESTLKPSTIWDRDKYINIWVVNFDATMGINGYAYLPFPPPDVDGIVVKHQAIGNIGTATFPSNAGRTLTHEMGHFFSLSHIWGDDLGCVLDDDISDTPQQKANNYGCPTFPNISGTGGSCSDPNGSMFMNYMDYTNDVCMNLFTQGQKAKMIAALTGPRSALLSSDGCTPTSALPEADFYAFGSTICAGGNITFVNSSLYATSYSWSFPGGTPSTSTLANPSITYNTAGTYAVTLTASNAFGNDVQTYSGFITVNPCAAATCQTLTQSVSSSFSYYFFSGGGYISGHNSAQDMSKADYYNYTGSPTTVNSMRAFFIEAESTNPSAYIQYVIWDNDGPSGAPGTILGSQNVLIQDIVDSVFLPATPDYYRFTVNFATPVPINGPFYAGIRMFHPSTTGIDNIGILSTASGIYAGSSPAAWSQSNTGSWSPFSTLYSLNIAHHFYVKIGTLPNAQFTLPSTPICPGTSFNPTNTTTDAISYSWSTPSATPSSSTLNTPSITYSTAGTKTITLSATNSCGTDTYSSNISIAPLPSITASASAINVCPGDMVTLTATGAGASGSYEWMAPSFSAIGNSISVYPTTTTTYIVMGTNASGCENSNTITINVNNTLLSISSTGSSVCSGGSVTLTADPSVGTFNWSPSSGLSSTSTAAVSASPSTTTTYTCTYTSTTGCISEASYTIDVLPTPTLTIETTDGSTMCAGTTNGLNAVLTGASGGVYTWNPAPSVVSGTGTSAVISPTMTTIYTLSWTNGGCSVQSTQEIIVETIPSLSITSTENPSCNAEEITLAVNGVTSGTYNWSSGQTTSSIIVNPTTSTTYTCVWSGGACSDTLIFTQNVHPLATPINISQFSNTLICNQSENIQWYFNNTLIPDATNDTLTPLENGEYYCEWTDVTTSCVYTTNMIDVTWSNIEEISLLGFDIFPNPFANELQIQTIQPISMKIFDSKGKLIFTQLNSNYFKINTSHWAKGIYFISIENENNFYSKKIVKN